MLGFFDELALKKYEVWLLWESSGVVTAPGVLTPDWEVIVGAVIVDELDDGEKNRNPEGLDVVDLCIFSWLQWMVC